MDNLDIDDGASTILGPWAPEEINLPPPYNDQSGLGEWSAEPQRDHTVTDLIPLFDNLYPRVQEPGPVSPEQGETGQQQPAESLEERSISEEDNVSLRNRVRIYNCVLDHYKPRRNSILVNPANGSLTNGSGMALAVRKLAGHQFQENCAHLINMGGELPPGQVVETEPYQARNLRYISVMNVIIVPRGRMDRLESRRILSKTYRNLFDQIAQYGSTQVTMSLFGCGTYGHELRDSIDAFRDALKGDENPFTIDLLIPDTLEAETTRAFLQLAEVLPGNGLESIQNDILRVRKREVRLWAAPPDKLSQNTNGPLLYLTGPEQTEMYSWEAEMRRAAGPEFMRDRRQSRLRNVNQNLSEGALLSTLPRNLGSKYTELLGVCLAEKEQRIKSSDKNSLLRLSETLKQSLNRLLTEQNECETLTLRLRTQGKRCLGLTKRQILQVGAAALLGLKKNQKVPIFILLDNEDDIEVLRGVFQAGIIPTESESEYSENESESENSHSTLSESEDDESSENEPTLPPQRRERGINPLNKGAKGLIYRTLPKKSPLVEPYSYTAAGNPWSPRVSGLDGPNPRLHIPAGCQTSEQIKPWYPVTWGHARDLSQAPSAQTVLGAEGITRPWKEAYLATGYDYLMDGVRARDEAVATSDSKMNLWRKHNSEGTLPPVLTPQMPERMRGRSHSTPIDRYRGARGVSFDTSLHDPQISLNNTTFNLPQINPTTSQLEVGMDHLTFYKTMKALIPGRKENESTGAYVSRVVSSGIDPIILGDPRSNAFFNSHQGLSIPPEMNILDISQSVMHTPGQDKLEIAANTLAQRVNKGDITLTMAANEMLSQTPGPQQSLYMEKLLSAVSGGIDLCSRVRHLTSLELRREVESFDAKTNLLIAKRIKGSAGEKPKASQKETSEFPNKGIPSKPVSKNGMRGGQRPPVKKDLKSVQGGDPYPQYSREEYQKLTPSQREDLKRKREEWVARNPRKPKSKD